MDRGIFQRDTLTVVVKTPNKTHGDHTMEGIHLNWTVKDLKTYLSSVYPTRPPVSQQRLIYSGKLLQDHQYVRDLFIQADGVPTLYLLCAATLGARPKVRPTVQPDPESSSTSSSSDSSPLAQHPITTPAPSSSPLAQHPIPTSAPSSSPLAQHPIPTLAPSSSPLAQHPIPGPAPSSSPLAQSPMSASAPSPAPELRHRRQDSQATNATSPASTSAGWPTSAAPGTSDMAAPSFPAYSLYSPQQLLWLQQMYARQCYLLYHASLAAAGSTSLPPPSTIGPYPQVPPPQAPVAAAIPNPNPIDNLPANPNAAPDAPFINPGVANQNLRMNAQGGPVMEDEDDMERDWLDWGYTAARLAVFLSIVYFYSNLSRFLLVMGSLVLMYLHTAGWFNLRRRPQVVGPQPQQNPENQPVPGPEPAPAEIPAADQGAENANEGVEPNGQGPMTAVLVPPHRVSIMWTAWMFFRTFFSSLIPDVPQGVAN